MTPEQKAREEKWAADLHECRCKFKARFMGALRYRSNKAKRAAYYQLLREEVGDMIAREVAKFTEGAIKGELKIPKWLSDLPDDYIPVPTVSNK